MNKLRKDQQIQVVSALVEGSSIRSVERMTGVHRDTIMRLGTRVGTACAAYMDEHMRELDCPLLQLDEIWCYVGKKQRHVEPTDDRTRLGDFWTFVAIDSDSKLVPAFRVGKRDGLNTHLFVRDLSSRVRGRVQISTDLSAIADAAEPIHCRSVGWLVSDTRDTKVLVPHISGEKNGVVPYGTGDLAIPTKAIVKMQVLRKG